MKTNFRNLLLVVASVTVITWVTSLNIGLFALGIALAVVILALHKSIIWKINQLWKREMAWRLGAYICLTVVPLITTAVFFYLCWYIDHSQSLPLVIQLFLGIGVGELYVLSVWLWSDTRDIRKNKASTDDMTSPKP